MRQPHPTAVQVTELAVAGRRTAELFIWPSPRESLISAIFCPNRATNRSQLGAIFRSH